ncbi:MAG: ABC transporter ATP-binding protein [Acidobacteriota bacterium]
MGDRSLIGRNRRRHLFSLLPYLNRYRKRILVGAVMVLLTNAAAVVSPWILRQAIDELSLHLSRGRLTLFAALIVAASLVEGIFRFLMRAVLIGVSRHIEYDLRNDLFAHLQRLSPAFYQRNPTGDLMARATNDLSAVRSVLGPGIMYSINTVFTTVLIVGILVSIDARLALLTLIPLLGVSLSVKYFGKRIHRRFQEIQAQFSELTTLVQENVAGVRVVKAYNQERAFVERFQAYNSVYMRKSLALVRVWGMFNPLLTLLLGLSSVGLLWYGGRQVIQGAISLGDFVAFIAYLAMLTWPTIALGWVINIFERGSASMGRINRILETQPEIVVAGGLSGERPEGDIEVKGLNFSYNGTPVLKNIRFRVRAGEMLAIVGRTGSGKSTLANLLCHHYVVPRATLFIDGVDINDIPLARLRSRIGYVPQDTFLFSETIRQNLAFGRPEASLEEVIRASKLSQIWGDIQDFPDRFETWVGERGITLSGGQKQRIAIGRALLVNPPIMVLDDALSSVDTYTEERILARLAAERAHRTTILISHRISTVKMADQILVLDEGKIRERGTHDELLQAGGRYAELHKRQLLREELGIG